SSAGISYLPSGTSGDWDLTLPVPKSEYVVNTTINDCVSVAPQGTFAGPGWYANYPTTTPPPAAPAPPTPSSPSPQAACAQVPVLATATLDVFKTIVNNTGETIAVQPAPFSGSVSCQQFPLLPVLTPGDGSWSQTDPSVSGPTTLS